MKKNCLVCSYKAVIERGFLRNTLYVKSKTKHNLLLASCFVAFSNYRGKILGFRGLRKTHSLTIRASCRDALNHALNPTIFAKATDEGMIHDFRNFGNCSAWCWCFGSYIFGLRFRSYIIILVMVRAEVKSRKYKNEQ